MLLIPAPPQLIQPLVALPPGLRVRGEAAAVHPDMPVLDRDDPLRAGRQQLAVVADQQHRLGGGRELLLQPDLAGHVKVVVGLVQQQDLVLAAQQRLQHQPLLLAAGQRPDLAPLAAVVADAERGDAARVEVHLGLVAAGVAPFGQRGGVPHLGRLVVPLHHGQLGGVQPAGRRPDPRSGATDSSRSRTVVSSRIPPMNCRMTPRPPLERDRSRTAASGRRSPGAAASSCPRRSARPGPRLRRRRPGRRRHRAAPGRLAGHGSDAPPPRGPSGSPVRFAGVSSPAGMPDNSWMDPQGFNENSRLRASDADRDTAAAVINNALAEGRLTAEEHSDRLDAIYAAKTHAELVPAARRPAATPRCRDRPRRSAGTGPDLRLASTRRGGRIVAIFGGASRKGAWHAEPRHQHADGVRRRRAGLPARRSCRARR